MYVCVYVCTCVYMHACMTHTHKYSWRSWHLINMCNMIEANCSCLPATGRCKVLQRTLCVHTCLCILHTQCHVLSRHEKTIRRPWGQGTFSAMRTTHIFWMLVRSWKRPSGRVSIGSMFRYLSQCGSRAPPCALCFTYINVAKYSSTCLPFLTCVPTSMVAHHWHTVQSVCQTFKQWLFARQDF